MKGSLLALGLTVFLLVASVAWAGPDFASMQIAPYDPPKAAPGLALPDLQGKTVSLGDLKGKVVLIWFWATW
jgi:cytochrome oxidase Cu insertion factor (SCO1/SenC/PrrC family)